MSKSKILCVDDTSDNLEILTELLSDYDVIVSLSGQNALNILKRTKVDMILLDIMMPIMDGFTLCQKIKEQENLIDIPLLFLSAKNDEDSIEYGYELGAVDYVSKPFKPKELLSRIKTHLKLRAFSYNLELEVEETLKKQRRQEHLLIKQSYAASMGQMIDVVAHQWLQPLNIINMRLAKLLFDDEDGFVDRAYLEEFQDKSFIQIRHLVETLNEFRSFMSPNKEKKLFSIHDMLSKVILLLKDELKIYHITVEINQDDFKIDAIENEFRHIIINIIHNAKDTFIEKDISNRKISIIINNEEQSINISDNAGGIEQQDIDTIFNLHVSSKKLKGGSGLGLYLSKIIVEKYSAKLSVGNSDQGACFSIHFF